MLKHRFLLLLSLVFSSLVFGQISTKVKLKTSEGDIIVGLYDDTPKHKENFLKLVKDGYYNGVLFHRVINNFMIQTGDPNSKTASKETRLGTGGPGYTVDAEINLKHVHKKGALAAARQPDNVNPERKSSGSQFYIVHGKKYSEAEVNQFNQRLEQTMKNMIFSSLLQNPQNRRLKKMIEGYQKVGNQREMEFIMGQIRPTVDEEYNKAGGGYSAEQIKTYQEVGGYPSLDGAYTVFGEVLEGLEIVDKIAATKTGTADRPVEDIKILEAKVIE